ncbi:hypothetical protein ABVT39_020436 [Epinephelus coioides]
MGEAALISHLKGKKHKTVAAAASSAIPIARLQRNLPVVRTSVPMSVLLGLLRTLKDSYCQQTAYVVLFDESLAHHLQSKHMDLHVRLWDGAEVKTKYVGSEILGHSTAVDIVEKISNALSETEVNNLIQLSMDGPHVNWKAFELLQKEMQKQVDRSLLKVGSCGLRHCHWMQHRDAQVLQTLCVSVSDRALKLWPYVTTYVERVLKGDLPDPKVKSFEAVKNSSKDPLFIPKVMIFNSIAREITPFLTLYQTDKSMLPFLSEDMFQLMKALQASFREFDPRTDTVDTQLHETMGTSKAFSKGWHVVKMLLVLSHGQANVERGFSINKELIVENQKEASLVAQRLIIGHIRSVGGVTNVQLTKELLISVSGARQGYHSYLDEQKRVNEKERSVQKRKALADELDKLKKKRARVENDIGALEKSADEYADKAESTGKLTFITKSNSFRRTANEKKASLQEIEKQIDEKLAGMKQ